MISPSKLVYIDVLWVNSITLNANITLTNQIPCELLEIDVLFCLKSNLIMLDTNPFDWTRANFHFLSRSNFMWSELSYVLGSIETWDISNIERGAQIETIFMYFLIWKLFQVCMAKLVTRFNLGASVYTLPCFVCVSQSSLFVLFKHYIFSIEPF